MEAISPNSEDTHQSQSKASSSGSPKRRLDYVDLLRGCACLWVMLTHSYNVAKGQQMLSGSAAFSPQRILFGFSSIGWLGVSLFLVISGFCLFYPMVRKNDPRHIVLDLREFAWRRAHRILPPYYIALGVFIVLEAVPQFHLGPLAGVGGLSTKSIFLHLVMLHNLQPDTIDAINVVFWSLALETQLYFVFPLLAMAGRKFGLISLVIAALIVSLAWQFLIYRAYVPTSEMYSVLYRSVPSRAFDFVLGMMAAVLVARPRTSQTRFALGVGLSLLPFGVWGALHTSEMPVLVSQSWAVIFACLLLIGNRVPMTWFQHPGPKSLTFLGTISYSVYLIHVPFFFLVHPNRLHLHLSGGETILFNLLRLLLAVGVGYLFFLVAEKPFINRRKAVV